MRTVAYLVLIALISFWCFILWGTMNIHVHIEAQSEPVRIYAKRPVCVKDGHPEFCKRGE